MIKIKISIWPKTYLGKWSVITMLSILVLFIVGSVLSWEPGYFGFDILIHNPAQGIITLFMLAFEIATLSMALISVVMNKERSALVFLAMLVGLYGILGFVGSIANILLVNL